jgi:hypothetical protein
MNQSLELIIDTTLNNRTYKLSLPFGSPYDDAFCVLDAFKVQLEDMQRIAEEQQKAQQESAQSTAA